MKIATWSAVTPATGPLGVESRSVLGLVLCAFPSGHWAVLCSPEVDKHGQAGTLAAAKIAADECAVAILREAVFLLGVP